MTLRRHFSLLLAAAGVTLTAGLPVQAQPTGAAASAPVKLRVFAGGSNQRPDLMRRLFDQYSKANPHVTIEI